MVGRADEDYVEVLLLQHLAVIRIGARFLSGFLPRCDEIRGAGQHLLVDVTQRNDFDRRNLDEAQQVDFAVPASANEADPLLHVTELSGVIGKSGNRKSGGAAGLDKLS